MTRKLLVLLVFALLFSGANCAPHDDAPVKNTTTVPDDQVKLVNTEVTVPNSVQERVKVALQVVGDRKLDSSHNFWTVFHEILGVGFRAEMHDRKTGETVKAIDYVRLHGDKIRGLSFVPTSYGVDVETQAGSAIYQGHQDQFVAEMVQWGLPPETEFVVEGKKFKFADFLNESKMRASVKIRQELSWAILIIAEHFGTNLEWTNKDGEKISFDDVVRYELNEPVDETAACGGTHRLFGFTWAYHRHRERGGKKEGVWKDAGAKIEEFKRHARDSQNSEFFWTKYVSGRDEGKDLASSGHVLEWLALALTDEELKQGWVEDAANQLALWIIQTRDQAQDGGAYYHAAHGLHIYYNRRWGPLGSDPVIPPPPKE